MEPTSLPALPDGWTTPQSFDEVVSVGELEIHLHGFMAQHASGKMATGSAASLSGSPAARAAFELCERVALIEAWTHREMPIPLRDASGTYVAELALEDVFPSAPARAGWSYAMSNGVALHRNWQEACRHAQREATERDAILRSWLGGPRPASTSLPASPGLKALATHYELFPVTFFARGTETVCGLFGFPKDARIPLLMGFGAGSTKDIAWSRCEAEAIQRTGFLWGEEIPHEAPELLNTAVSQQEYYLYPEHHHFLRAWLAGEHELPAPQFAPKKTGTYFADLTAPTFRGTFAVAKAMDPTDVPLVFGQGHPFETGPQRVQPIG